MPDLTGHEQLFRETIAGRFRAGDTISELAEDYEMFRVDVEQLLREVWAEERAKRSRRKKP